jgi:hypothetical protein
MGSPAIMVVGETVRYADITNTSIGAAFGVKVVGKARQI